MRRALGSGALLAALLAGLLAGAVGCASEASLPATSQSREPVARDGGYQVSIPALWADDASGLSGTEPARIWATEDGSAQFTIRLADVKAQGAGAQWTAASAAAAAVGSMASGLDPGRIDVDFGVTGPIDGPSAGGVLTVGVLAALLGAPIRGDMTMTGTIGPDGSIGAVGGIALKLRAAAEQGYRTVLLPVANLMVPGAAGEPARSAVDLGSELGLEVIPVANVQQAFTKFTDGAFAYPSAPPFALPQPVSELVATQTKDLLAIAGDRVAGLPAGDPANRIGEVLGVAQASARAGRTAAAYGVGMLALNQANRERAAEQARARLAEVGPAGAQAWLADWTQRAQARNSTAFAATTATAGGLGYEQQLTLPNALSWLAYNEGILLSVQQGLQAGPLDAAGVDRYARILADVDAAIDVYFPDQRDVVLASPARPSPGQEAVADYLSSYTTFLVRAGQAQQEYVQQVVLPGADLAEMAAGNDVGLLLPVVLNLRAAVDGIPPSTDSISDEITQATTAITYYIATSSLIAAVQDFGIREFGIGADPSAARQPAVMRSSVQTAKRAVDEVSALLGQRGLDASLPVWAASFGTDAADALAGTPDEAAAAVLALNELYFDAISVFMIQSGPVA